MNAATAAASPIAITPAARDASVANPRFDAHDTAVFRAAHKAVCESWTEGPFYSEARFSLVVAGEARNFVVRASGTNLKIMTEVESRLE